MGTAKPIESSTWEWTHLVTRTKPPFSDQEKPIHILSMEGRKVRQAWTKNGEGWYVPWE